MSAFADAASPTELADVTLAENQEVDAVWNAARQNQAALTRGAQAASSVTFDNREAIAQVAIDRRADVYDVATRYGGVYNGVQSSTVIDWGTPHEGVATNESLQQQYFAEALRQQALLQQQQHGGGQFETVGRNGGGFQKAIDWEASHEGAHPGPSGYSGGSRGAPAPQPSSFEIQERWRKVLEEEARLATLRAQVEAKEANAQSIIRRLSPNFPRKFLCFSPLVHHDISEDIPAPRQNFMKLAYGNWWATFAMLVLNFILNLIILMLPNKHDSTTSSAANLSQHVGLSVAYLTGIPLSFMTWYWQMYKACAFHNSVTYVAGFIGLLIGLAFSVFMAIGIVGLGGTGVMFASQVSDSKGTGPAIPIGIMSVLWVVQAVVFIVMMVRLKKYYNEDGASLEEAQRQVTTSAAKSYARHQL